MRQRFQPRKLWIQRKPGQHLHRLHGQRRANHGYRSGWIARIADGHAPTAIWPARDFLNATRPPQTPQTGSPDGLPVFYALIDGNSLRIVWRDAKPKEQDGLAEGRVPGDTAAL